MPDTRSSAVGLDNIADMVQQMDKKSDTLQESFDRQLALLTVELRKVNESLLTQQQDILSIRDVIIKQLQDENAALKDKVSKMEARIEEHEGRSSKLTEDVLMNTKHIFANDQYMRQNNIEIDGIPDSIDDATLEKTCAPRLQ